MRVWIHTDLHKVVILFSSGQYVCTIENVFGRQQKIINLRVTGNDFEYKCVRTKCPLNEFPSGQIPLFTKSVAFERNPHWTYPQDKIPSVQNPFLMTPPFQICTDGHNPLSWTNYFWSERELVHHPISLIEMHFLNFINVSFIRP